MNKIVFIASLSHSGSTLLNLILGSQKDIISLGEIFSSFDRMNERQNKCTCGKEIENCIIWSSIQKYIVGNKNWKDEQAYNLLIEKINQKYGKQTLIVDSSKNIRNLKRLQKIYGNNNIKVLFLIKDIRNFVHSQNNRTQKKKNNIISKFFSGTTIYNIIWWYLGNKRIIKYLTKNSFDFIKISYESLCLETDQTLDKTFNFLNIKNWPYHFLNDLTTVHNIRGNPMRFRFNGLDSIKYDHRWIKNNGFFDEILCAPFIKYNKKMCINEIKIWKKL